MPAPSGYPTSTVPDWATNPGVRVTPPAGLQATGWVPGMVLPAGTDNGLVGPLADWCGYLAASSPSLGTWDVVDINVWDGSTQYGDITTATISGDTIMIFRAAAAAAGLAVGCLGGDKTTLLFDAGTNTVTVVDLDTGDNHWQSSAAAGFIGPRASADGTTGLRYSYPAADPVELTYTISPRSTPWVRWGGSGAGYPVIGIPDEYFRWFNDSGGTIDLLVVVGLGVLFPSNVEAAGTVYTVTEITVEYDVFGVGQDVKFDLGYIAASAPGTWVSVATDTATTGTGTLTWTGSAAISPAAREYMIRYHIENIQAANYGSGIRVAKMTVTKTAVE